MKRPVAVLLTLALSAALAAPAHAEDKKTKTKTASSYWTVSFLGGIMLPRKAMKDTYKEGLSAGGQLGWTSKIGFGLHAAVLYSPLSRQASVDPLETFESHFGLVSMAPHYVLRWKALRLWGSAGAGIAADRTRRFYREVGMDRATEYSAALVGSAGIEFHFMSSGGLAVVGNYARTTRNMGPGSIQSEPLKYEYLNVSGGLVFVFR